MDNPSDEIVAEASIAVSEAKIASTEAALYVSSKLIEFGGASATLAKHNLDRHWWIVNCWVRALRGALSIADAQAILRDSIETQQEIMDAEWAPVNEAAAVLLTRFSEAVERQ